MRLYLKKLDAGISTSKLVLEHSKIDNDIDKDLRSLAILLGGYNEFGRSIPYEEYKEIKDKFNTCVSDIKTLLKS